MSSPPSWPPALRRPAEPAAWVARLAEALQARGQMLCTAESCTGGLIAAACTERAGSSAWFERGFVTYSNAAKSDLLGVPADCIARHGAVSREVALAMAEGALRRSRADWALAVTGIAGPTGGSVDKPVGTVWLAWATRGGILGSATTGAVGGTSDEPTVRSWTEHHGFPGDRAAVRLATVQAALAGLLDRLTPA